MNNEFPEEWSTIKCIEFLIEEQVDGYASGDYESYYPSIKKELMPKIRSLIAKDKVELLKDLKKYMIITSPFITEIIDPRIEELENLTAPGHERNT